MNIEDIEPSPMTTRTTTLAVALLLRTFLLVVLAVNVHLDDKGPLLAWAFLHNGSVPQMPRWWNFPLVILPHQKRQRQRQQQVAVIVGMVRNIDLPECLIFYGKGLLTELIKQKDDDGLISLLQECKETNTGVIAIIDSSDDNEKDQESITKLALSNSKTATIIQRYATQPAPNPRDLYEAIQSIIIQPRPFGGSAGFGSKLPDPERCPMPARTVVLCQTLDETRAARFCGMRVLCFTDNDLADAVMNDYCIDFYLDDIATPGSYWLNPPHPRYDDGNKVPDIESLIRQLEQQQDVQDDDSNKSDFSNNISNNDLGDSDIDRILADLAPL